MSASDVVVLGAGIEGLCAALTLARGRRGVTVLESRASVGGSAAREEFHPGFHASGVNPDASLARREHLNSFALETHGLRWRDDVPALLVPHASGCPLLFRRVSERMDGELPPDERARLVRFERTSGAVARLFEGLIDEPPPDAAAPSTGELLGLAWKALELRRLGKSEMLALARILPSSAQDWMDEALRMDALRVALTAPALAGTVLGPRAPGTSLFVLLRHALGMPEPVGGPGMLVAALHAACTTAGVEVRTSAPARSLRIGPRGVEAVELASGEVLGCRTVLSTLAPATTLLGLVPAGTLGASTEAAVRTFRARGATSVLRLALAAPPRFAGREQEPIEHAVSAPDLVTLERAADCLKYRRLPAQPWVEVRIPSRADPTLAPAGKAVAIVQCHTVPHDLTGEGGWSDSTRARLTQGMLAAFERLAPGVGETILAQELLTPPDVERRYGTPGGHLFDGELALDQLWLQRPSLALCRYATPIPGLYLGGSGSHPGGPFRGGAGVLAARALLARG